MVCERAQAVGRNDEGLRNIERAANLDPLSAIIQENWAGSLAAQGRFADAESQLPPSHRDRSVDAGGVWKLGPSDCLRLNRFADAVPLAQKALELDPGDPGPTLILANLYLDLGDEQKFVVTMEQAEKRWPKHADVLFWLALSTSINETRPDCCSTRSVRSMDIRAMRAHWSCCEMPTSSMVATTRH